VKEIEMALHHANSGEIVDLSPLGAALRSAHTTALVKSDDFEAVRLVVHAGSGIPSHRVDGKFTLQCLEGRVRLGLASGVLELSAGQWVYFDGGVAHSVEGIEDSSLLLTILFDRARVQQTEEG
jgi:quercetin dioxygenase-like cupin family protein